jgi:hypothetical protein
MKRSRFTKVQIIRAGLLQDLVGSTQLRFSRSSSRIRALSALVGPARSPASRCAWRAQTRRLSGEHPSARSAATSLAYLGRCSKEQPHGGALTKLEITSRSS